MKLILHIGTQKTGSTSIQSFLNLNKDLFKNKKVLIPESINYKNSYNHRWLCGFAYNQKSFEKVKSLKKIDNIGSLLISEKIVQFKNEIIESDANLCIISSEHLSIELKTPKRVEKLKNNLKDIFDDIEIIIYIRKPIKQAISLLSTQIKGGSYINIFSKNYPLRARWFRQRNNIKQILNAWESNFSNNVKVRIFEKEQLYKNDLIEDFCKTCKIDNRNDLLMPNQENISLDVRQLKYINYLNKLIKLKKIEINNIQRIKLIKVITNNIKSNNYFQPSKKEFVSFQNSFNKDEKWICKKYFSNSKNLWLDNKITFRTNKDILNAFDLNELKEITIFLKSSLENLDNL